MSRCTTLARLGASAFVILTCVAGPVTAQDARSILETMQVKQAQRWATVENYTVVKSVEVAAGMQSPQYFVKMEVDGEPSFRLVPPPIYEREMLEQAGFPPPSAEMYEAMATGYDMLGPALEAGGGDQPPMPGISQMTDQMADFMRMSATALDSIDDGSADAEEAARDSRRFAALARLEGTEPVLGHPDGRMRDAYRIVADTTITQTAPGGSFTLHTATVWLDTEQYVPYRIQMEGEVESDGQTRPITIERLDLDYRDHGPLYVAHREVGRISGLMSAMSEQQRREMEDATRQLAEAEAQLARMPDGPGKEMAERMMLPQIDRFRQMVAGGTFETAVDVVSVAVNEGPPTPYGLGRLELLGAGGALTWAIEQPGEFGDPVAVLSVTAGLDGGGMALFGLIANLPYPDEGGAVTVVDVSGDVSYSDGRKVNFDSGTGSIVVTDRTETRIAGTFEAQLTGTDENGAQTTIVVSGTFDSGAPAGANQAPRGSPIPAMFGMGG